MTSRDSSRLALGSAASGLLAYVFFALASRSLGADQAAPVSVLWSYWAMSAAVLTFPVQHWIIRKVTVDGHEAGVARTLPLLWLVVALLGVVAGLLAYLFRQRLFGIDDAAFPAMVAGITLGSFFIGVVRGVLSGRGRFGSTALSLATENGTRVALAALAVLLGGGSVAVGVALVLGPLSALVWLPSLRLRRGTAVPAAGHASLRESLSLLSGVAGGSLIGQAVLTGAPVVLAAVGGAPASVTSLFLALAVWRAPYIVAMGVTPQLTAALTRVVSHGPRRQVVQVARATVAAVAGCSAVAALLGLWALQPLLRVAFGADVRLHGLALAGLGVGTMVALGNLVLLLVLLALGRSRAATAVWLVALALAAAWLGLGTGTAPAVRVVVAFLVAEVTAFALLEVAIERFSGRGEPPSAEGGTHVV